MEIIGPHHIALLTTNFDELRAFYVETLGFPVVGAYSDRRIMFIGVGNIAIELIENEQAGSRGTGGWGHVAFEVADVDADLPDLGEAESGRSRGGHRVSSPLDATMYMRVVSFTNEG